MKTSSAKVNVKELKLGNSSQVAIVDEDDFYRFRSHNWYGEYSVFKGQYNENK
jgi:hypothetical protein